MGYLVWLRGQRGGSSQQNSRAALALGEGCQAQIPQDWPPEVNPGWHGMVALGCVPVGPGTRVVAACPSWSIPVPDRCGGQDRAVTPATPRPCHFPPALLGELENTSLPSWQCHHGQCPALANTPGAIPRPGALDELQEDPSIPARCPLSTTCLEKPLEFNS